MGGGFVFFFLSFPFFFSSPSYGENAPESMVKELLSQPISPLLKYELERIKDKSKIENSQLAYLIAEMNQTHPLDLIWLEKNLSKEAPNFVITALLIINSNITPDNMKSFSKLLEKNKDKLIASKNLEIKESFFRTLEYLNPHENPWVKKLAIESFLKSKEDTPEFKFSLRSIERQADEESLLLLLKEHRKTHTSSVAQILSPFVKEKKTLSKSAHKELLEFFKKNKEKTFYQPSLVRYLFQNTPEEASKILENHPPKDKILFLMTTHKYNENPPALNHFLKKMILENPKEILDTTEGRFIDNFISPKEILELAKIKDLSKDAINSLFEVSIESKENNPVMNRLREELFSKSEKMRHFDFLFTSTEIPSAIIKELITIRFDKKNCLPIQFPEGFTSPEKLLSNFEKNGSLFKDIIFDHLRFCSGEIKDLSKLSDRVNFNNYCHVASIFKPTPKDLQKEFMQRYKMSSKEDKESVRMALISTFSLPQDKETILELAGDLFSSKEKLMNEVDKFEAIRDLLPAHEKKLWEEIAKKICLLSYHWE